MGPERGRLIKYFTRDTLYKLTVITDAELCAAAFLLLANYPGRHPVVPHFYAPNQRQPRNGREFQFYVSHSNPVHLIGLNLNPSGLILTGLPADNLREKRHRPIVSTVNVNSGRTYATTGVLKDVAVARTVRYLDPKTSFCRDIMGARCGPVKFSGRQVLPYPGQNTQTFVVLVQRSVINEVVIGVMYRRTHQIIHNPRWCPRISSVSFRFGS